MQVFDLHCDTLFKANEKSGSIINNDYEFSLEKALKYDKYTQVMAVWMPDGYYGDSAENLFEQCYKLLKQELKKCTAFKQNYNFNTLSDYGIILSIEGGSALAGKLENIPKYRKMGVRFLTLTWNGNNEIGDGIQSDNPKGLTEFGRKAIPLLEENGIIIDVSHASEPLFWDVAETTKKPFVATHSNSRTICSNMRNLTDEQFKYICKIGGIVGLNFHRFFITDDGKADFSNIQKHFEHFLLLGGENAVALGSDFDGADMPNCIKGAESMYNLYDYLLSQNYNETLLKKLFYDNASNFLKKYDDYKIQ